MEFKSLKNIETSFRQIRFFALVFLCLCAGITIYSVWNAFSYAEAQRQKIYVLDQGKSLMLALSQDMDQNRPVEARDHVTRFHDLFFTLSPDRKPLKPISHAPCFLPTEVLITIIRTCRKRDISTGLFQEYPAGDTGGQRGM